MSIRHRCLLFVLLEFISFVTITQEAHVFPLAARRRLSASDKCPSRSEAAAASGGREFSPIKFRMPLRRDSNYLVAHMPIGSPSQYVAMVLDTGSELSWFPCRDHRKKKKKKKNKTEETSFDPGLSTSFRAVPCNNSLCKKIPTLGYRIATSCDHSRNCHFSFFYADESLPAGYLFRDKFARRPFVTLGCGDASAAGIGTLGMNLGALSFASHLKLLKFSYCAPPRPRSRKTPVGNGSLILGENPHSAGFRYVKLLTFHPNDARPNLDTIAYTVPLKAIEINGKKLDIPCSAFVPGPGGSCQTIVDSGTPISYFVDDAYNAVKAEIQNLTGTQFDEKYQGELEMCFNGSRSLPEMGRRIGKVSFYFDGGAAIEVEGERNLVGKCVAIGRSSGIGYAGNILGNHLLEGYWVEIDRANLTLGFGKAEDCSK